MDNNILDTYKDAYNKDFQFHDEHISTHSWYGRRMIRTIRKNSHIKSVLSLGVGHKIISKALIGELNHSLYKYTIVEGAPEIIKGLEEEIDFSPNIKIVNSYFENYNPEEKFDAIEMGFVLEHVDDPFLLVNSYKKYLQPEGLFFIAVPNANSLHRQIGFHAGMLEDTHKLSEEDFRLGHKRYFDKKSFTELLLKADLRILKMEGILLKPFSTPQLKSLNLSAEVLKGLLSLGIDYPDISNSIYAEASL